MIPPILSEYLSLPEIAQGKMFGWHCLTFSGNVVIAWQGEEGIAFKLSKEACENVFMRKKVVPHDPGNRGMPMKQWVYATDASIWPELVEMALAYGSSLPPKQKAKKD